MKLTERELYLLQLAMHMADSEGGWEYPPDSAEETTLLYVKIGGTIQRIKGYDILNYPEKVDVSP